MMRNFQKKKQCSKILGGILILGLIIYIVNIRPALANYNLQVGFRKIELGNQYNTLYTKTKDAQYKQLAKDSFASGVVYMQKAIEANTYQSKEFREALAETVMGFHQAEVLPEYKAGEYLGRVLQELEESILDNPRDAQVYAYTMAAYNLAAKYNLNYLDRAIELGDTAIKLSPTRQQIYSEIAKSKISQRKKEEAIAYFQKAVDLNPDNIPSHWNLAILYIKIGKIAEVELEIKIMEKLGYSVDTPSEIQKWIGIYEQVNDVEKLAELYNKMLVISPTADRYMQAAAFNQKAGNIEKAKEYALKAAEINEELKDEVTNFIKEL